VGRCGTVKKVCNVMLWVKPDPSDKDQQEFKIGIRNTRILRHRRGRRGVRPSTVVVEEASAITEDGFGANSVSAESAFLTPRADMDGAMEGMVLVNEITCLLVQQETTKLTYEEWTNLLCRVDLVWQAS